MYGFDLQAEERIVRVLRQSCWVLIKPFVVSFILFAVPWWYIYRFALSEIRIQAVFWSVIPILYFVRAYRLWSLHSYIVTTKRLIKTHHETLFKRLVVETPIQRILNVSFRTTGFVSVLGRFGDVEVQVVGLMEPIILENIQRPAAVKEYLWRAHQIASGGDATDIAHLQEKNGYTKPNQKVV